jgi:hypothetical protein
MLAAFHHPPEVEITSQHNTTMGHLQNFEAELRNHIASDDTDTLVSWVKEQVLQSYRNGLAAKGTKSPGTAAESGGWKPRPRPAAGEEPAPTWRNRHGN